MNKKILYISLEQSVMVPSKNVTIGDIATIFCIDNDISHAVKKIHVFTFTSNEEGQAVITVLKLISLINTQFKEIQVECIGNPETIVYYKNLRPSTKFNSKLKAGILMVIAFFGTGFSIMSYNGDVGSDELMTRLYTMFVGSAPAGDSLGMKLGVIAYSIGLGLGMIIFFNHGIAKNSIDDPTPLQVQMRLYEQDVNRSIIIDSERNNKTIDVD